MTADSDPSPLFGRTDELHRLRALFAAARNGTSGAIIVRGEPGIGKTALLAHASAAAGIRVVRADGFEAEAAMPYAGVQRIVEQLPVPLDALPERQRSAVRTAIGQESGTPPSAFLVGLGLLSLLAHAADLDPVACVVDDAHLLDAETLQSLAFVARRLSAESTVILLATRDDATVDATLAGLPELRLGGLDPPAAAQLIALRTVEPVDPFLVARIVTQTAGNPLVLHDLASTLTVADLETASLSPDPMPLGAQLEAHYVALARRLPTASREWLNIAAAETTGDLALIRAVAQSFGIAEGSEEPAEVAGLVRVGESVRFRHPLVRAAVYADMTSLRRRRIHHELREHSARLGRSLVAAWHASATVSGEDAAVADLLQAAADDAGSRGGLASRARLLARAALLTPAGSRRDERLLDAAEAALASGAAVLARDLLGRIDEGSVSGVARGRVVGARAMISIFLGEPMAAAGVPAELLRAAGFFEPDAPAREQRALLDAFAFALTAEWQMTGTTPTEIALRLRDRDAGDSDAGALALRAVASLLLDSYAVAFPLLEQAWAAIDALDDDGHAAFAVVGVTLTIGRWDAGAARALLIRAAHTAREHGDLRSLDAALWVLSAVELTRSDPAASLRAIEQVRELRRAIGYDGEHIINGALLAWLGAPRDEVVAVCDAILPSGMGGAWTMSRAALAIRDLADGRYQDAFDILADLAPRPFAQAALHHFSEYVEAGVRAGHRDAVEPALLRLRTYDEVSATPWIRGVRARAEALWASDHSAEEHYLTAITHLARADMPGELARAHLLYGEWLRRLRRRKDAAIQLHTAWRIFDSVDARPFADRARRELEACGVSIGAARDRGPASQLTAQEAGVARLAARGSTNTEIGAAMFISANTVDYHLRKVFRKLGITSRRQLSEHIGDLPH